jgi:hypothetical protein
MVGQNISAIYMVWAYIGKYGRNHEKKIKKKEQEKK